MKFRVSDPIRIPATGETGWVDTTENTDGVTMYFIGIDGTSDKNFEGSTYRWVQEYELEKVS